MTAYYDPQAPGEAFLERQRSIVPYAAIGIGGLFGLIDVSGGLQRLF